MNVTITHLTKPDSKGRIMFILDWHSPNKAYCAVCGHSYEYACPHRNTEAYGRCAQVFFRVPPVKQEIEDE